LHAAASSATSGGGGSRAEAALLRLAQRLLGRSWAQGPGGDVLRLFTVRAEEVLLDEMMEAVSVLPLGISRAEVQSVFTHIRGQGAIALPLALLASAAEQASAAGVPYEAAGLEQIDFKRLAPALQRLDTAGHGRASPQEFRVALMQAEPYLTHSQLEWLALLTDKDGEGRLLPGTLLSRLGAGSAQPSRAAGETARFFVASFASVTAAAASVAPTAPQSLVVAAALGRVRDKLFRAGPQLTLESVLGLYDISAGTDRAPAPGVGREILALLLGHLRLGISVAEADVVIGALAAGGGKRGGADSSVKVGLLCDMMKRVAEPDMEGLVTELREAARQRLLGRGSKMIAGMPGTASSEWIPEAEFRRGLRSALADDWTVSGNAADDEEDRIVLLGVKNAAGDVCWRPFVQALTGWPEFDPISDIGDDRKAPSSPTQVVRLPVAGAGGMSVSQQSWRSGKAAQHAAGGGRSVVTPLGAKMDASPQKPSAPQRSSFVCCRRRCLI